MNKLFLSALALLMTAQFAEAKRIVKYEGAYDGKDASQICKKLNVTQNKSTGTKHIYANSNLSVVQCNSNSPAWLTISMPIQFGYATDVDNRTGVSDLSIEGELAQEIYQALNVKEKITARGASKKSGKLECSLTIALENTKIYSCTMFDIALMTETNPPGIGH